MRNFLRKIFNGDNNDESNQGQEKKNQSAPHNQGEKLDDIRQSINDLPAHAFPDLSDTQSVGPEFNGARLESLLRDIYLDGRDNAGINKQMFYQLLIDSAVLLPLPAGYNLDDGIPIISMEGPDGETAIPVFSSEESMSYWVTKPTEYVGVPFTAICTSAIEANMDYIVINASNEFMLEIPHCDFTYLADRLIPPSEAQRSGEISIEKNTELYLAPSGELSPMVQERLSAVFNQRTHLVDRVYTFNVAFSDGPMKTALGIGLHQGQEGLWDAELWPDVQATLQEVLGSKEYMNVFLLNECGDLEGSLQELTDPFYTSADKSA